MNVVRRSEEEDSFSKASGNLLDWKTDVGGIGKPRGEYALERSRDLYAHAAAAPEYEYPACLWGGIC